VTDRPPVLFLDVDGVINDREFLGSTAREQGETRVNGVITRWDPIEHIDDARVTRLNVILEATGADIVLSTSWRLAYEQSAIVRMLRKRGLSCDVRVIDCTPSIPARGRHLEIKRWLSCQYVKPRFVILDDDQEAGVGLEDFYVRVEDGLEDRHVERAIQILGRRQKEVSR
jgi:hypothetical protein